ncbi:hypothetical protein ACSNOI_26895 [Actinomadura kijaniata]|uniref:hypothetical protein n=1 Tax=Actinomadura kijaniata TaxID=46161 RepID=UPI003F1E27F4
MRTLPASPVLDAWRARRRLDRLARALRARGWVAEPRYADLPPLLRVYAREVPAIGDSVLAVRHLDGWWFRSGTGVLVGPCAHAEFAAERVGLLLTPWGVAALTGREGREPGEG